MLDFITGPLFVISLVIFTVGMLARVFLYVRGLDWRLERIAYSYHTNRSIPGALASIFKWLIPGGTDGWRTQPVATTLFFLLHFGAVLVPLFLLAVREHGAAMLRLWEGRVHRRFQRCL